MTNSSIYPCIVKKEDGWYYVDFPDFEACFSDGKTLKDALQCGKDVLSIVINDLTSRGEQIPLASQLTSTEEQLVVYFKV